MKYEPWFAWYPVTTVSNKIVWLQLVKRAWNVNLNYWGDFSGHAGTDGGWQYKTIRKTMPFGKTVYVDTTKE